MLSFCVLGSGSKGNSTLVSLPEGDTERFVLIDCGLSPRATTKRLGALGIDIADLSMILVTHLDGDHFRPGWIGATERFEIPVMMHHRHRNRAVHLGVRGSQIQMFRDRFEIGSGTIVDPVLFAHDDLGTVGYIIEHDSARFGLATDLGRVPHQMPERFAGLHALAIESNYDPALQLASDRPRALKERIMGGRGHLSNEESIKAVEQIESTSRLAHVVTLHVSQQCNDARLIKALYARRLPHLLDHLTVSRQNEPTPMLEVRASTEPPPARQPRFGEQLAMF